MSIPLDSLGVISGLGLGFLFGFVLESAGFGSACKLTAQLRFQDWAVFKVMFTAILVAAAGLYLLQALGQINLGNVFIPSVYLWGTLLGGVGVGAGMAVGGYCPGTSAVALFSGKLDGLLFLLGIGFGTLIFNGVYPYVGHWAYAQTGPSALTLPQFLHLPSAAVLAILAAILVGVGLLTRQRHRAPGTDREVDRSMDIAARRL